MAAEQHVQKDRGQIDADGFRERWCSCNNRVQESRHRVPKVVSTGKQAQLRCAASIGPQPGMARLHARIVLDEAEALILYDPIFPAVPFSP